VSPRRSPSHLTSIIYILSWCVKRHIDSQYYIWIVKSKATRSLIPIDKGNKCCSPLVNKGDQDCVILEFLLSLLHQSYYNCRYYWLMLWLVERCYGHRRSWWRCVVMDHTGVKERRKVGSSDAQSWRGWKRRRKKEEGLFWWWYCMWKEGKGEWEKKRETFNFMKTCQIVIQ